MVELQELLQLEEDVNLLEEAYPQGEKVRRVYFYNYIYILCVIQLFYGLFFLFRQKLPGLSLYSDTWPSLFLES